MSASLGDAQLREALAEPEAVDGIVVAVLAEGELELDRRGVEDAQPAAVVMQTFSAKR